MKPNRSSNSCAGSTSANGVAAIPAGEARAGHAVAAQEQEYVKNRFFRESFDREYVQRLVNGDPETERHFTEYFGKMLRLRLHARLRAPQLVEDLSQEVFLRVLTCLRVKHNLASPERLGAFVNSVCNNVLMESHRLQARTQALSVEDVEPVDAAQNAESALLTKELQQTVQKVLRELSERDRDLLRMVFHEGCDKDWICRYFQIDREYLRVLLHRAKTRFRERLLESHAGELPADRWNSAAWTPRSRSL